MASTLTSSSTRAEIHAAYLDNASYEEDASPTKCKAFITACRFLLSPKITPARSRGPGDGGEAEYDLGQIRGELESAQRWLALYDTDNADGFGSVKHVDFSGFRD